MATTAVTDIAPTTTLLSLPSEERRKILLESLREGYPSISKVSRPVSSRVSRYVSQFTSGRWRERIWFSDESVDSGDLESEMSSPETEEEPQLVIFGHNLHSEDYLKEREMMARWNIVERELHFPDLEKGYVQKRDAKTQSDVVLQHNIQIETTKDADVVTEPTTDVSMEECKESNQKVTEDSPTGRGLRSSVGSYQTPQKVTKDNENSPTGRGLRSSIGSDQTPTNDADVVTEPTTDVPMEECKESSQKVTEGNEDSPPGRGLRSSVGSDLSPQKFTKDNEDSPTGRGLRSSVGSNQTPANDADVTEPTDVPMEECKESPQKVTEDNENSPTGRGLKSSVTEDNENSPTGRGLKSSVGSEELDSKVEGIHDGNEIVEQTSSYSDHESKPLVPESKAPEDIQSSTQHESFVPHDKERQGKMATASKDSKDVANSSSEMKTPETISNKEMPLEEKSVSNAESSVTKDGKEVSAVPDPKLAESAKMETSDANSAESGAKTTDPISKSSPLLEAKESVEKMEASTNPEDSSVESIEKVLETSKAISKEEKMSVPATESLNVPEVERCADKMDAETVQEHSKVARTSETDAESSGSNLRGKRKADSLIEDDPDEKRTKKTSVE